MRGAGSIYTSSRSYQLISMWRMKHSRITVGYLGTICTLQLVRHRVLAGTERIPAKLTRHLRAHLKFLTTNALLDWTYQIQYIYNFILPLNHR